MPIKLLHAIFDIVSIYRYNFYMAKVKTQKFTAEEKNKFIKNLSATILKYKNTVMLEKFLRDFFTPSEIAMLARRIQVANGLIQGKGYRELHKELGVGMTTVQFVDRWMRSADKNYKYAPPGKHKKPSKNSKSTSNRGRFTFLYSVGPNPYFFWRS